MLTSYFCREEQPWVGQGAAAVAVACGYSVSPPLGDWIQRQQRLLKSSFLGQISCSLQPLQVSACLVFFQRFDIILVYFCIHVSFFVFFFFYILAFSFSVLYYFIFLISYPSLSPFCLIVFSFPILYVLLYLLAFLFSFLFSLLCI